MGQFFFQVHGLIIDEQDTGSCAPVGMSFMMKQSLCYTSSFLPTVAKGFRGRWECRRTPFMCISLILLKCISRESSFLFRVLYTVWYRGGACEHHRYVSYPPGSLYWFQHGIHIPLAPFRCIFGRL